MDDERLSPTGLIGCQGVGDEAETGVRSFREEM